MNAARGVPLIFLGLVAVLGAPAGAQQTVADSVQFRNQCRLAAQVLELGEPANKRAWAAEFITACPDGAVFVAKAWDMDPVDATELARLELRTSGLADERLSARLRSVAENASRPLLVRVAALSVLASYVRPGARIRLDPSVMRLTKFDALLGYRTDSEPRDGEHPVDRSAVIEWAKSRAAAEPDSSMRSLMERFHRALAR